MPLLPLLERISGVFPTFCALKSPQDNVGEEFTNTSLLPLLFRWACDDTVTHYIYQGRVGDNTREYRGVKERGLHVVSQYWLQAVRFPACRGDMKLLNSISLVFVLK